MEAVHDEAGSERHIGIRPTSEFETNLSRVCGIPVRRRGLLQAEIEALCMEYDVHGVPEDSDDDLVEGPLLYGDEGLRGEPLVGEGDGGRVVGGRMMWEMVT